MTLQTAKPWLETSTRASAVQQTPIVMLLRSGRGQGRFVAPRHRAIRATGRVPPLITSREATPGLRSRSTEIADLPTAREGRQTRRARARRCWEAKPQVVRVGHLESLG